MKPELGPAVAKLFDSPAHAGRPADAGFAHGRGGSVRSGGLIDIWLKAHDGQIVDARFEAFGCPATIACGEWLCAWLIGRSLPDAERLRGLEIAQTLALPAAKRSVALKAEDALKAALAMNRE